MGFSEWAERTGAPLKAPTLGRWMDEHEDLWDEIESASREATWSVVRNWLVEMHDLPPVDPDALRRAYRKATA